MLFQLYLHQVARKLNNQLKYSYGSSIKKTLPQIVTYTSDINPTVADIIQVLIISYNIGHFQNTFSASRAVILSLCNDEVTYAGFVGLFENDIHKELAKKIIRDKDYHCFHLLNSLLMLLSCDTAKPCIALAINALTEYLLGTNEEKLKYAYSLFRNIRNLSYVIYDLYVAPLSLYIDITDEQNLENVLTELLSEYNDSSSITSMVSSIQKLLSDTIYNEPRNCIHLFGFTSQIQRKHTAEAFVTTSISEYISNVIINPDSLWNRKWIYHHDFDKECLKITFDSAIIDVASIACKFEKMDYIRAGYYDRPYQQKQTLIISILSKCPCKSKVALKVVKKVLPLLVRSNYDDVRYILLAKFLLYYVFDEHPIKINSEIDNNCCVITVRGKKARVSAIQKLLKKESSVSEDKLHEIKWLLYNISKDDINDTAIMIPASVLVYDKARKERILSELDGMIIYPYRETILFLEAKNTKARPRQARKDLIKKFSLLNITYENSNFGIVNHDVNYEFKIT